MKKVLGFVIAILIIVGALVKSLDAYAGTEDKIQTRITDTIEDMYAVYLMGVRFASNGDFALFDTESRLNDYVELQALYSLKLATDANITFTEFSNCLFEHSFNRGVRDVVRYNQYQALEDFKHSTAIDIIRHCYCNANVSKYDYKTYKWLYKLPPKEKVCE